jgi:hypothetical protein
MSSTLEEVDLRPEPVGEVRGCEPYGLRTLLPGIGAVFDIVGNQDEALRYVVVPLT